VRGVPFKELSYCVRCALPETLEGMTFDEMGMCPSCRSSEDKMRIDWDQRERDLGAMLLREKELSGSNYDCILPISGGKDSFFQAHVLVKKYGLRPLAVTFSHNWFSETGFYNLQRCLEVFDLDQIQFTPSRRLVNRLARKSLSEIGDACWHCHSGVGAFPMQVAVKWKIPLLVWGESIAENDGRGTYRDKPYEFDREYFTKVSAKKYPSEMVDGVLTEDDMRPFDIPSVEEIEAVGVRGIHLGDYIFWDDERQTEFIREEYGWKETEIEGAYKGYKTAECIMPGVHDFTCYLKRGFGRSTWQAATDVRNGLLTRDEAFEIIRQHDPVRPDALDYFLEITELSEKEFMAEISRQRVSALKGDLPVLAKTRPNLERTVPFVQQVIEKHLGGTDRRDEIAH
jgi:N-acetyl sugar amidotransferase